MAAKEVSICCSSCHGVTATSKNDWAQFDLSHIIPKQKPWYTATAIEEDRDAWPYSSDHLELHTITSSKASCTKCGRELGAYCRNGRGGDAKRVKEHVIYDQVSIYLRDISSSEPVEPAMDGHPSTFLDQNSKLSVGRPDDSEQISAGDPWPSRGAASFQEGTGQGSSQEADIGKLSTSIGSLQDRMLSLERSVATIQVTLKAVSESSRRRGHDAMIDDLESMLRAAKDARYSWNAMQSLKAENEKLKQQLGIQTGKATKKATAAARKAATTRKRATSSYPRAGSLVSVPVEQDQPSHLGGLDALNQITDAMSQAPLPPQAQPSDPWLDEVSAEVLETLTQGVPEPGQPPNNNNNNNNNNVDAAALQGRKRGRSPKEHTTDDQDPAGHIRKRRNSAAIEDTAPGRHLASRDGDDGQHTDGISNLQRTELLQRPAAPSESGRTPADLASSPEETAVDPALRSAAVTTTSSHHMPGPDILATVENPPTTSRPAAVEDASDTAGQPIYDSVHETRIMQYKARDALRKRISSAKSLERMNSIGDAEFKREEKIRARDRMVQELMEREEMLESEGDL